LVHPTLQQHQQHSWDPALLLLLKKMLAFAAWCQSVSLQHCHQHLGHRWSPPPLLLPVSWPVS
jgi:hypothetical protein